MEHTSNFLGHLPKASLWQTALIFAGDPSWLAGTQTLLNLSLEVKNNNQRIPLKNLQTIYSYEQQ